MFDFWKKTSQPPYLYTRRQIGLYEKFIESQCGQYSEVFHEIVSPDIHLDIIVIPPNENRPYYTLVTMGMGAYRMAVPGELKKYHLEHAELMLRLPPDWNIKSDREEDYWPIRMMKVLGRLPIQCSTWLGYGHTVFPDAQDSTFAENTKFCSTALLSGLNQNNERMALTLPGLGNINFYQLFPIYKEELEFKCAHDMDALLDRFEDEDLNPMINIARKNYGV